MAVKKVGELIREARTNAGLSQEALAKKIDGLSASDLSKAERGEKELTKTVLREIAKATGVTQKSLLEAPSGVPASKTSGKTSAAKTGTAKTGAAKTGTAKTGTAKTASRTGASKTSSTKSGTAVELTAAEKTLLNAYRKADAETRKAALSLLKGEKPEGDDLLSNLLSGAMDLLGGFGK